MSVETATGNWWNASLAEVGVQAMDRTLSAHAGWDEILRSGREELEAAMDVSGMQVDATRRVLDLGCGVGRVAAALADRCGEVVGVDISPSLIETAKSFHTQPNLRFEHTTGSPLQPDAHEIYDTVFANEVFYYLPLPMLADYARDAFRLLHAGGEYVFQLNMDPIGWKTRPSWRLRTIMYTCGIKKWRGWSNSPGFTRYFHSVESIRAMLESAGFQLERVNTGLSRRQTWFVARKPHPVSEH